MSTGDVVPQWTADRIRTQDTRVRNARRCLFGTVDHAECEKFVNEELEKQSRLDQEKWNFDFEFEQPINDKSKQFEWEPIRPHAIARVRIPRGEDLPLPPGNQAKITSTNGGTRKRDEDAEPHHITTENGQTQITDFMRKRKHSWNQRAENHGDATSTNNDVTKHVRRSST